MLHTPSDVDATQAHQESHTGEHGASLPDALLEEERNRKRALRLEYFKQYNALRKEEKKAYSLKNKDRHNKMRRESRQKNKEYWRQYWRDYRKSHPGIYRQYYLKNKEKRRIQHRIWRTNNKATRKRSMDAYRHRHPDRVNKRAKLWREKNKEHFLLKTREYRLKNAARIKSRMRDYHQKHYANPEVKEKIKEQAKRWKLENPSKYKVIRKRWENGHKHVLKAATQRRRARKKGSSIDTRGISAFIKQVKSKATVRCYYCGKSISTKKCHFDHIQPLAEKGMHAVSNLCVSCSHCNLTKHDKSVAEWYRLPQQLLNL
jgi:hypothetical protein